jgi:hypothetical protein
VRSSRTENSDTAMDVSRLLVQRKLLRPVVDEPLTKVALLDRGHSVGLLAWLIPDGKAILPSTSTFPLRFMY